MNRPSILQMLGFSSLSLIAAVGCGSSGTKSPGSGGSGGAAGGNAGTTGSGGKGGTTGAGGTTGSAGTTGTGGMDASAGSICNGGVKPPASGAIADFNDFSNTTFGTFGVDFVTGGTYDSGNDTYLVQDFSGGSWRLHGQAYGSQSFFGIFWNCSNAPGNGCTLDVSKFAGIQFTIKSAVANGGGGPSHQLGFSVGRPEDDVASANAECGTCVATHTPTSLDCLGPRTTVNVPTDGTTATVQILWSQLANGMPVPGLTMNVPITGIIWFFQDLAAGAGVPDGGGILDAGASDGGPSGAFYPVDLTLDDIKFIPAASDGGGN